MKRAYALREGVVDATITVGRRTRTFARWATNGIVTTDDPAEQQALDAHRSIERTKAPKPARKTPAPKPKTSTRAASAAPTNQPRGGDTTTEEVDGHADDA